MNEAAELLGGSDDRGPNHLPVILEAMATYTCGHQDKVYGLSQEELGHYFEMARMFACTGCYLDRMCERRRQEEQNAQR